MSPPPRRHSCPHIHLASVPQSPRYRRELPGLWEQASRGVLIPPTHAPSHDASARVRAKGRSPRLFSLFSQLRQRVLMGRGRVQTKPWRSTSPPIIDITTTLLARIRPSNITHYIIITMTIIIKAHSVLFRYFQRKPRFALKVSKRHRRSQSNAANKNNGSKRSACALSIMCKMFLFGKC